MKHVSLIDRLRVLTPCSTGLDICQPKRKSFVLTQSNNAFVKPVKQDFVRNARLMPGTRCMVLMLMGWAGQEQALETTIGIIANKLGRSRRQVQRYLRDAIEEGILFYSRTKDRMGYYTGIKVHLNFMALKPSYTKPKSQERRDVTLEANTNKKPIYTDNEQAYMDKIEDIIKRNNLQSG